MLDKEIDRHARRFTTLWDHEMTYIFYDLQSPNLVALVEGGSRVSVRRGSILETLLPKAPDAERCEKQIPESWAGEQIQIDGWTVRAVFTKEEYSGTPDYAEDTDAVQDTVSNAVARATERHSDVLFRSVETAAPRWVVLSKIIEV